MNRQEFVDALQKRLLEAGFSDEYANEQCQTLHNRLLELPDSTVEEYTTTRNLDIVVRKLIAQDSHLRNASAVDQAPSNDQPAQPPKSATQAFGQTAAESAKVSKEEANKRTHKKNQNPKSAPTPKTAQAETPSVQTMTGDEDVLIIDTPESKRDAKARLAAENPADQYITCDHPKLLTALLFLLCAPTIILLLGVSFGVFAAIFIVLAAAILAIVLGIIVIVSGGSVISLASLLYGATQVLSTTKYIGLHEIGFGLLVAGITMAASILLYNIAVRLIPFLFEKIAQLTKLFAKKLVTIAQNAVKGCEQL